jgi:hypothetical protein
MRSMVEGASSKHLGKHRTHKYIVAVLPHRTTVPKVTAKQLLAPKKQRA